MKKRSLFISLCIFTFLSIKPVEHTSSTPLGHIHISLANTPHIPIHIHAQGSDINQQHYTNTHTDVNTITTMQTHNIYHALLYNAYEYAKDAYTTQKESTLHWYSSCIDYMKTHYIITTCAFLCTAYGSYCSALWWHTYHVQYKCTWSNWNIELSVPNTNPMLYKEFKRTLIIAIQEYYQNNIEPTDFLTPLRCFLRDIDYELRLLKQTLILYQLLNYTGLHRLFYTKKEMINHLQTRIKRAQTLKDAFKSWCADYTLQINNVT